MLTNVTLYTIVIFLSWYIFLRRVCGPVGVGNWSYQNRAFALMKHLAGEWDRWGMDHTHTTPHPTHFSLPDIDDRHF